MQPVEVESLSYGAHGVVRVAGKVCFVRNVAPGDWVELVVREDHGSYAFAEVEKLVRPGSSRREPPCPYLPGCGGCPWQHVDYATQAASKERCVRELLSRIGGIGDPPVLPIIEGRLEYGYRRRLSLRVEDGRVGYFAAASHQLVPVADCLLATPELGGAIPIAQEWVARLRTRIKRLEIVAAGGGDRLIFAAQAEGDFAAADRNDSELFLHQMPRVAGLVVRGRRWRRVWGDDEVAVPFGDGGELRLHAGNFVQVNEYGNAALVAAVCDFASDVSGAEVLDLYAGAGNLSLPLARRGARVTAVERMATSAADGRANAARLGIDAVTFVAANAVRAIESWVEEGRRADLVVLDPPRSGAAPLMPLLLRLAPRRIVYVSCNPSTLARDVRALAPGYCLGRAQPIDFFPQTYHVEVVADLVPGQETPGE